MLAYLDSVIVIYAIEGEESFRTRALSRLKEIIPSGDQPAISHLTCLECLVNPVRDRDDELIDEYDAFFTSPVLVRLPMNAEVFERATFYRSWYGFGLADALHLATAAVHGCGRFLTNDLRLERCADLKIEMLA